MDIGPIPTLFETGLGGRGGDGMRSDGCGHWSGCVRND